MLEPTTAITDFLLSFENITFSLFIILKKRAPNKLLWFLFFLFIGLGAFQGALFHGFSWAHNKEMWQLVTLFLVLGITVFPFALSTLIKPLSLWFVWGGIFTLSCAIAYLLFESKNFLHIIVYEVAMLLIGMAMSVVLIKKLHPSGKYLLAGIFLSFLAAGLQQSDLQFSVFNNNDLFHIVQIIGQALFFMSWKEKEQ